ncbi:MAG: hypothetical protein K2Y23_18785 [Cyanobacteria bacterium]|nr:hypothetical protein [Cyanobacteriota bacterium]
MNRGFGMLDHRLFMVTLDAHLLAFDRTTGVASIRRKDFSTRTILRPANASGARVARD